MSERFKVEVGDKKLKVNIKAVKANLTELVVVRRLLRGLMYEQ